MPFLQGRRNLHHKVLYETLPRLFGVLRRGVQGPDSVHAKEKDGDNQDGARAQHNHGGERVLAERVGFGDGGRWSRPMNALVGMVAAMRRRKVDLLFGSSSSRVVGCFHHGHAALSVVVVLLLVAGGWLVVKDVGRTVVGVFQEGSLRS